MKKIQKILVPVDFSQHASEAIAAAVDVSQHYEHAPITVVHVYQPVAYVLPESFVLVTPAQLATMLVEFDKQLKAEKQTAEKLGAKQVNIDLLQGNVEAEIIKYAHDGGYDLIVMGTHGRTGVKHAVMGSVAERVLRKAPCPVLTVRAPT